MSSLFMSLFMYISPYFRLSLFILLFIPFPPYPLSSLFPSLLPLFLRSSFSSLIPSLFSPIIHFPLHLHFPSIPPVPGPTLLSLFFHSFLASLTLSLFPSFLCNVFIPLPSSLTNYGHQSPLFGLPQLRRPLQPGFLLSPPLLEYHLNVH